MDVLHTDKNKQRINELYKGTLKNRVVNVSLAGGIVGLFISLRQRIENEVNNMNAQGYKFVYSLGANSNIVFLGFAIFVLFIACLKK